MPMNRRGVLALLGSGGALGLPGIAIAQQPPHEVRFAHGVASGDPSADGAVIWTRATAEEGYGGDIPLAWRVSTSPDGAPIASGQVAARASADHTAKVEVTGLAPGRDYFYRFEGPGGARSQSGRFRTLPTGAVDELVFAVASCQLYPGGLFNAYADMAALPRLDAVVHLGDYIYEYGETGYGADIGRRLGRLPDPPHEIVSLADYRRRHAQVKSDPDLQAAHARAAFICVWDDHEVTNDGWIGGAENHQPQSEGDWAGRKAVAMQAYFEWMPIRDPDPLRAREAIFRTFEFGHLATLAMVETRLLARDRQAAPKGELPAAERVAALLAERERPERELLGRGQSEWLEGVLGASVRAGKPWQLLGNQVVMARVAGPDLEASLGAAAYAEMRAQMPAQYRAQIDTALAGYRAGVPFNLDSWDGYPHARERLYELFARAGSRPLVLSGDSHAAWTNNLHDRSGRLAGVEVGCTAISSPSYGSILPGLGRFLAAANDEVIYCDQDNKGYALVTLTPEQARVEHVAVSTIFAKPFERRVAATFRTRPDGPLQALES
ncbi:alkaline phosphatase D family protein [Pelagerythrobacter aerophilus]|uniref:Alkaline phosphatase n=1 Tax=Pelagerythrobacter aerophilus TaxID=2306995 RepID=A0A418NKG6_9SPHN|nr:alkaline phosphatase D family protein [Pelagerythrobacter aerophilus]RIV79961.1 alkaline phosphatase [Pelagerythrobacter aerophilus]